MHDGYADGGDARDDSDNGTTIRTMMAMNGDDERGRRFLTTYLLCTLLEAEGPTPVLSKGMPNYEVSM